MKSFGEFVYRFSIFIAIIWLTFWALIFILTGRLPNPEVVLFRLSVSAILIVSFGWLARAVFR